jgi:hypothetical protein
MLVPPLTDIDRAPPPTAALGDCLCTYRRWLHLDDDDQVIAALGAIAANLIPGEPLWMLFVGSPGSGKTETIAPLAGLEFVHEVATVTEAALLSGTPKREIANGAKGGLLRELGEFGVMLVKDFSGVLTMNRDARAAVLSALREVYDGRWTRRIGSDGGRALHWFGKAGLVGAVTPSIDRHHAVMGALGERFILYRLHLDDPHAQAKRRLANRGRERQMRAELATAVADALNCVDPETPPRPLDDAEEDRLVNLAVFVVNARTAVERDGYDREVVVMPAIEAPGRLVGALGQLLAGCEAVGADQPTSWRIVVHSAWGCVPEMRRRLLEQLRQVATARTAELVSRTEIPKNTAERALEDLTLLGMVERTKSGTHDNAAWQWSLAPITRSTWPYSSPEMSGPPSSISTKPGLDDISGELFANPESEPF